jgi:acyl carrier protein
MTERIQSQITELFREHFDDDSIVVTPTMNASDIAGWDSLAHVSLMLTIERRFNIRMSAHEISSLKVVGDMISLIESKLAGSGLKPGR